MIKFDTVTKKYPNGTIALDDISVQIDDNDFVFLVGPSGAGKTTILKLILKQTSPSSGTIIVNDENITDKSFKNISKLRQSIGIVFQDFKILHHKNVFENIAIALKISKTPNKQIQSTVEEVLALVGLEDKKLMFPIQLSAGELQRIAIARALVGERSIILADEPTGNLDPKTSWDIINIFKKLDGLRTIIIATHNAEIVNAMKKRVITLTAGKIIKDKREGTYKI